MILYPLHKAELFILSTIKKMAEISNKMEVAQKEQQKGDWQRGRANQIRHLTLRQKGRQTEAERNILGGNCKRRAIRADIER